MSEFGHICIGGPHDGEVITKAGTSFRVEVAPDMACVAYDFAMAAGPVTKAAVQYEYRLQRRAGHGYAWVFQG